MAPPRLERYNGLPAVQIQVKHQDKSSGDAMLMMVSFASKLPSGIGYMSGRVCHTKNVYQVNPPSASALKY